MRVYLSIFVLLILLSSCSSGTNLNLFSIKEDKEFGKKVADQIEKEGKYKFLDSVILKFLDSEDQFAGVLGHEIAHADLRHSTRQMTEMFGIQLLLELVAGDSQSVKEITSGLIGLTFSRSHEKEADAHSVKYLCPTKYNAAGGAGFFEKLVQKGGSNNPPVFLSTHPDPGNRVEKFKEAKLENGCLGNETFATEYKRIISKLP